MQRNSIEARVDLTYGYLAADMISHRIESLRIDSENPLLLQTSKNLTSSSGLAYNFKQFKGHSPEYLVVQNNATTGTVTVEWNNGTGDLVTTIPANGGLAVIPDPHRILAGGGVESPYLGEVVVIKAIGGTALVDISFWGYSS